MRNSRLVIGPLIAVATIGSSLSVRAGQTVEILQNGFVQPNPAYPYIGHNYYYEHNAGDNDMPWLRDFAQSRGIFANINMSLDWKDREFDMMKAIIWFTSHNISWTSDSTFPDIDRRARTILEINDSVFGVQWGCGHVAYAAIGLAQAQGIPARAISTRDANLPPNGDYLVEMYSTRYNRWILLFQKGYGWIEHEDDGPLGIRELQAYDRAGPIQVAWDSGTGHWSAVAHPPLVFMPSPVQFAPVAPFFSEKWNTGRYQYIAYTARTNPNGTYPACCLFGPSEQYLVNDNYYNVQNDFLGYGSTLPVVPFDDPNANYPLNNVQAELSAVIPNPVIKLTHNMFQFLRYEAKVDNGPWQAIVVLRPTGGPSYFAWTPPGLPSTLYIRGVTVAGVHSPDVVISARSTQTYREVVPDLAESN